MSLATVSLSVNDSEMMKKPTHIIMWQDDSVSSLVTSLTSRVEALEKLLAQKEFRTPLISGIDMKRRSDSIDCLSAVLPTTVNTETVFKELLSAPLDLKTITIAPRMGQDSIMYADITPSMCDDQDGLEGVEEILEEVEEEEEEQEEVEVEEEEQEEEALELEEFEYKGVQYYRDAELQVYQLDTDGDLDETPIGVWNEQKQKVLKYAKA
jgi:DNA-directed RNA polymerase beta' subunit